MYATTEELAEYLAVDEADLPDDAERLLERASEMIDYYTLNRIDDEKQADLDAAKQATMAQYEWWEQFDEFNTTAFYQEIQIGSFRARNAGETGDGGPPTLAPRAKQVLFLAGLLNRGVRLR